MLLHRRLPIFWERSPVEFLQNLTPKIFFDSLFVLSTQAYDQSEATVTLDGKLYTFPKSFTAIKDIALGSLNRAIVRMHSLNASDAALLIAMGTVHFAYKKIQKHRTGRTAVMHLFLKEVNHIMNYLKTEPEKLKEIYPECDFISNWENPQEEGVLKCAILRFIKIGSLTDRGDAQVGAACCPCCSFSFPLRLNDIHPARSFIFPSSAFALSGRNRNIRWCIRAKTG